MQTQLCWLFATPQTIFHQTPLSMGLPRQEYWSGLSFPFLGALLDPGTEPVSPALQADSLPLSYQESPYLLIVNKIIIFFLKGQYYFIIIFFGLECYRSFIIVATCIFLSFPLNSRWHLWNTILVFELSLLWITCPSLLPTDAFHFDCFVSICRKSLYILEHRSAPNLFRFSFIVYFI